MVLLTIDDTVGYNYKDSDTEWFPYYGVPSVIAVNMILAGASGGIVAIIIATWAQVSQIKYLCIPAVKVVLAHSHGTAPHTHTHT